MELLITILIIAIAANIITNQIDPLNWIKDKMGIGSVRRLKSKYTLIDLIIYIIWKVMNCSPCLSYWITGIYFLPTYEGFILGILTYGLATWIYNNVFSTKIKL